MILTTPSNTYAGDVSVHDAWAMLAEHPTATLVDVRTPEEWSHIGTPDISSLQKEPVYVSWRTMPQMQLNTGFESELADMLPGTDEPTLFLCKAGGRSLEAAIAMAKRGYTRCYNIIGGFEDPANGWKINQLPWRK